MESNQTDEPSFYDKASIKSDFLNALAADFLEPVTERLKGSTRSEQKDVLLLARSASKKIIAKASGTRSGDDWKFTPKVLTTEFENIVAMLAGLNCRYESYNGIRSAFAGYREAIKTLTKQLDSPSAPSDPPSDFDLLAALMITHEGIASEALNFKQWSTFKQLDLVEFILEYSSVIPNIEPPDDATNNLGFLDSLEAKTAFWGPMILIVDSCVGINQWFCQQKIIGRSDESL